MIEGPISPAQARAHKENVIPTEIFTIFNDLIALDLSNGRATVYQKDVVSKWKESHPEETFNYKWLNVEEAYTNAGWKVKYDKPGYSETYNAHFIFYGDG